MRPLRSADDVRHVQIIHVFDRSDQLDAIPLFRQQTNSKKPARCYINYLSLPEYCHFYSTLAASISIAFSFGVLVHLTKVPLNSPSEFDIVRSSSNALCISYFPLWRQGTLIYGYRAAAMSSAHGW